MARRSRAREVALQLLYQRDQNRASNPEAARDFLARRLADVELEEYGNDLYSGTVKHVADIDRRLAAVAENWSVERMAVVDRNVLRMGLYELHYAPVPVPPKVVIDEAVELAKRYGSEESPAFVNGILDRLASRKGGVAAEG